MSIFSLKQMKSLKLLSTCLHDNISVKKQLYHFVKCSFIIHVEFWKIETCCKDVDSAFWNILQKPESAQIMCENYERKEFH